MIQTEQTIDFAAAQKITEQAKRELKENQIRALQEYIESDFQMLDSRDMQYYEEATGLNMFTLSEIAIASTIERQTELERITKLAWSQKLSRPLLKYNPFKKMYYKYYVHSERWFPAYSFQIKNELQIS